jgi:hypothetical protein
MAETSITFATREFHEHDPIWAGLLAESPLPSVALQCLYVAPLRIILHLKLIDGTLYAFLRIARELGKLPFGLGGKLNAIVHVSRRSTVSTLRA